MSCAKRKRKKAPRRSGNKKKKKKKAKEKADRIIIKTDDQHALVMILLAENPEIFTHQVVKGYAFLAFDRPSTVFFHGILAGRQKNAL
ncbi:uncharacterized protein BO96DRAFT_165828 [Aspergillus niger CBS 101883]|uniref:uncharacterized protein n=1 Tax=Aspergillus lacticoffeatus (strain CBS 101883) TaxID=1450533 RepID=UPI000D7EF26C|nr:uncharacterized protein BO96DRAFT_165828 [Aspergillus niger CBS 101883]PYH52213.1 hypothetical protein BO96DRAFT_165828 [Aspergillus niger CBS 101883]